MNIDFVFFLLLFFFGDYESFLNGSCFEWEVGFLCEINNLFEVVVNG